MQNMLLRKIFLGLIALGLTVNAYAYDPKAKQIVTDTTSFNKNLSSADTDVQKALETLDDVDIVHSETDPVYGASTWASTDNNASDWDTAYGWGNHADAGYLTTALISAKEDVANKVTSLSSGSTDTQYPSAKLVYDQLAGKQATGDYLTVETDPLSLHLNQTEPQTIINGAPILGAGLNSTGSSAYGGSLYNLFKTTSPAGLGANLYTNFTYNFSAGDLPFSIISRLVNSGTTVATAGAHGGAILAWYEDTATANATHFGIGFKGRADGKGINTNYSGVLGMSKWYGNDTTYNGLAVGVQSQVDITQTDMATPLAQGTAISFFAPAIVGGASKFAFLGTDPIKTLSSIYSFDSAGTKYSAISHDGTDGYLTSSSGHLRLASPIGSYVVAHSNMGFMPASDELDLGATGYEWGTAYINNILSDTGTISFDNENLITTGTLGAGAITGTSLNLGTGAINTVGTITPAADSTYNIGSSAPRYFANAYLDKVFLNPTATLDGATADLVNLTGNLDISGHATIGDAAGAPSNGSILKLHTNTKDDCYTGINLAMNNTAFGGEEVTGITLFAQAAFSPKAYTLASSLITGAKTATLTSAWLKPSSTYNVIFSNGDVRVCTFTLGSATFTWTTGLSSNATTAVSVEKVCTGQSGALSGHMIFGGTNTGTSVTNCENAALFYGLYSGTSFRSGSRYRTHYGIDTYGDWGYLALVNGYATIGVRAKANANGLGNAFLNYGYTAAFFASDSEDPQEKSYIGGTPRQYQHYVAKPTRATNSYQILLAGNGSGTGVFFNGSGAGVDQASVQRIYHDGTNLKVDGNIDFGKITRSAISYTGGLGATKIDIADSHQFTGTATTNYVVDIQTVNTKSITAITKQSGTVINIACTGHGLSANQTVELSGMSDSRYDGWYMVTAVPTADTFRVWMDFYGTATGTVQRSTWRWSDDGGSTWDVSNIESCFGYRDLNNGIRVGMLSTVGIAVGNQASWSYTPANYATIDTNGVSTTLAVKGVHKAADGTAAVADGTYTVGIGGTTNGTITIKDGIITAVQQAVG